MAKFGISIFLHSFNHRLTHLVVREFWDEYFWLPQNTSWSDMTNTNNISYPQVADLRYTVIFGFALLIVRILLESFAFLPLGWIAGFISSPLLPRIWKHVSGGFAGKSKFKKVAECAWRLSFYVCAWTAGLMILMEEPQLKDISECWRGWPHHNITIAVWWYYILEASFYWASFVGTLFIDVRRADFSRMLLHHAMTILLLYLSWSINMVRYGVLVLFTHDAADILLETAKIARYANWQTTPNVVFLIFLAVWSATRLIYYPFWLLPSFWQSFWFDVPNMSQSSYRLTNFWHHPLVPRVILVMLLSLLVLHVFWTYVILKIAKSVTNGGVDDVREESDIREAEKDKDE
ncbi:unnamed protein product [Cylicocyclus nassatus]|uniref:TLC domain-containing protein n=1 Tax=Cylicocyclus nassatus TaxID=53992 RepID=A0AA36MHT2_CYLNA|nr:unnamed protein product [Cylicocyclus nassatus]